MKQVASLSPVTLQRIKVDCVVEIDLIKEVLGYTDDYSSDCNVFEHIALIGVFTRYLFECRP